MNLAPPASLFAGACFAAIARRVERKRPARSGSGVNTPLTDQSHGEERVTAPLLRAAAHAQAL